MFLEFHLVWLSHSSERGTVEQRPQIYVDNSHTPVADVKNAWSFASINLIEIRVMVYWQGRAFTLLSMIDLYKLIICLFLQLRFLYLGYLERYLYNDFTISIKKSTKFLYK
jgi:hypothetical protein